MTAETKTAPEVGVLDLASVTAEVQRLAGLATEHLRRGGSLAALVTEADRTLIASFAQGLGAPVACHSGCAACCVQEVACHPVEILVLASHLRRTRKRAEIAELLARLKAHGPRLPCPLLSPAGTCTVYAQRPLKCCEEHSLDAAACQVVGGSHPMTGEQLVIGDVPSAVLIRAAHTLNLDAAFVLLSAGLVVALTDPAAEARWRRGERIFSGAGARRDGRRSLPVLRDAVGR